MSGDCVKKSLFLYLLCSVGLLVAAERQELDPLRYQYLMQQSGQGRLNRVKAMQGLVEMYHCVAHDVAVVNEAIKALELTAADGNNMGEYRPPEPRVAPVGKEVTARALYDYYVEQGAGEGGAGTNKLKEQRKTYQAMLEDVSRSMASMAEGSGAGFAIATGMAGTDAWILRELEIDSPLQGIGYGLLFKGSKAIGDKIEETVKNEVGGAWDTVVGGSLRSFKHGVQWIWNLLFHGGYQPFNVNELELWKREILSVVLEGLDKRAQQSEKQQCSGRDARLRSILDTDKPEGAEASLFGDERDPVWELIARGHANDLERIAQRIELHKPYYGPSRFAESEEGTIIALAERLQEVLLLLEEHIILPARSLRDLASGDMKLHMPHLIKEVEHRFTLLTDAVCFYHGITKASDKTKQMVSAGSTTAGGRYGNMGYGSRGVNWAT